MQLGPVWPNAPPRLTPLEGSAFVRCKDVRLFAIERIYLKVPIVKFFLDVEVIEIQHFVEIDEILITSRISFSRFL